MKIRTPLNKTRHATIIRAYTAGPDNVKEQFYSEPDNIIQSTPQSDKLIIARDFNDRMGKDSTNWQGVIGKDGVGTTNGNGLLLLSKCFHIYKKIYIFKLYLTWQVG
jgi:hypothetical protein